MADETKDAPLRRLADLALAVLLFVLGVWAGTVYVRHIGSTTGFYPKRMGPAVMWACGRGFVNPDASACPPLRDFLACKRVSVDLADIPAGIPTEPPNTFQRRQRYLMMMIAATWRLLGISWLALAGLFGLFYGFTVAAVYGLFRQGIGRVVSFAGALLVLISPVHFAALSVIRDYAKAPFFLTMFLVMVVLVLRRLKRRWFLILCGVGGALAGIGTGFRSDLFLCIPAFLVTVLVFSQGDLRPNVWRSRCGRNLAGAGVFIAVYFIVGFPVLTAKASGSNAFHLFLLGLAGPFDEMLGVSAAPYGIGPFYVDEYVAAMVNGQSRLFAGNERLLEYATPAYDQYASQFYFAYARHFPADMLVRAYAATLRILDELPFCDLGYLKNAIYERTNGTSNPILLEIYGLRYAFLSFFQGWGRYLVGAALLAVAARSLRSAAWGLIFILYFAGTTMLQFAPRHIFHLEFISLCALGWLLDRGIRQAWHIGWSIRKSGWRDTFDTHKSAFARPCLRAAVFAVFAAGVVLVPLYGLRAYQYRHVGNLLTAYAQAPTESTGVKRFHDGQGRVLLSPASDNVLEQGTSDNGATVNADFLVFTFERQGPGGLEAGTYYETDSANLNWSTLLGIPLSSPDEPTRLFLPVFETSPEFWAGATGFRGLVLRESEESTVRDIARVTDYGAIPLLLQVVIPADLGHAPRYQKLTR